MTPLIIAAFSGHDWRPFWIFRPLVKNTLCSWFIQYIMRQTYILSLILWLYSKQKLCYRKSWFWLYISFHGQYFEHPHIFPVNNLIRYRHISEWKSVCFSQLLEGEPLLFILGVGWVAGGKGGSRFQVGLLDEVSCTILGQIGEHLGLEHFADKVAA